MTNLRQRLATKPILVAPGGYDALSVSLIERAGFEAAYLSGASIAYTRFGRPDIGLVGMSEVAEVITQIRDRVELPLIVDGDTGFGNALNVQRTVRAFERAGASAIQLEDQQSPKRCGHLSGKTLVTRREMVGKIRAACDARASGDFLIVGRTDALALEGLAAALDRADAYLEAGADVMFVEALPDLESMRQANRRFAGRAPLLANMVEGGKSPMLPARELEALGFSIAIFPGAMVRVQTWAAQEYLSTLAREGTTDSLRSRMLDFGALNALLGTEDWLARGKRYDG